MKENMNRDKEIKKVLDDAIEELDENFRKAGHSFLSIITKTIESKISELWKKNKMIVKNKINKEMKNEKE